MKEHCLIKSFTNGINLVLNPDSDFEDILNEIGCKFADAKNFFNNAKMALSIEGRILSNEDESAIVDTIRKNCNMKILCIVEHDEEKDKSYIKALDHVESKLRPDDSGQFYRGSLRNGEEIETENSIVILGDVYPGCSVVSSKSIIIIGGLYGEAYAGANGDDSCYVVALEMEPTKLKIGDFRYKSNTKQNKWGIRPKIQPKIAYVKNKKIVFESLTKELLDSFS